MGETLIFKEIRQGNRGWMGRAARSRGVALMCPGAILALRRAARWG